MTENKVEMDALQRALNFEKEGKRFYSEAKEKTRHQIAQSLFETLVQEEGKHISFILALRDGLEKQGAWPKEVTIDIKKDFKLIFSEARKNLDEIVDATTDELEAMNTAVEMETKGEKMYHELAEKARTPEEKNVYDILAGEEAKHREFAEQYYHYFADKGLFTEE